VPIPFHCPHCGAFTEVDDVYAGRTGPCASCRQTITIPAREPNAAKSPTKDKSGGPATWLPALALVGTACLVLLLLGVLIATYFVPSVATLGKTTPEKCRDNLRKIAAAMRAYHDEHGHFPPAHVADDKGRPRHSWRVLLLPYVGEQALYDQYQFDEPWNSRHNQTLIKSVPNVYACPDGADSEFGETSYVVICGNGMLFDKDQVRSIASITDRPANTLLVVEVDNSAISWSEPRDLDASEVSWNINRDRRGIGSAHAEGGANVAMADGIAHHFADFLPSDQLRAMATIDGGEPVQPTDWAE
jgi:hypothetical protein